MKTTEQSDEDNDTNDESDKSLAIKCCYNDDDENGKSLTIKRCFNGGDESYKSLARTATCSFYRHCNLCVSFFVCYRTTPKC